jgi:hypothetical protein
VAFPSLAPGESRTSEWLHPAGAHAWVELFVDGAWELADPSWVSGEKTDDARRRWFGHNDGSHVSYGTADESRERFQRLLGWANARGRSVCALSAPLCVAAAVRGETGRCTPTVTVSRLR